MKSAPFPKNEMARITELADMNVDYFGMSESFKDLTKLAAKVTGSPISLINLIDNYTVWTISSFGIDIEQTPREQSVCQYTILEKDHFAVNNMTEDPVFHDADFVTGDPGFRFYFGVPLATQQSNLGALCVLDMHAKSLDAEKIEMLKIIADEIMNRLRINQYIENLRNRVTETKETQNKVMHDIRGPIAGIMALAEAMSMQGKDNDLDEVLEFVQLIYKGGKSVLELADDILTDEKKAAPRKNEMMLRTFQKRLEQLYEPQARGKNVKMSVIVLNEEKEISFPQNKMMQIAGNLISNAIKFTPKGGQVDVTLNVLETDSKKQLLQVTISDTGKGIDPESIQKLLADNEESADGTDGETGYGFGLALVKHLVKGLGGTFTIESEIDKGSKFVVAIPFAAK